MRCTSVFVQCHTLPSETFFKPVIAQVQFGNRLLEGGIFFSETNHFIAVGFSDGIS